MKPVLHHARPFTGYVPNFFDELFNDFNSPSIPKSTVPAVNVRESESNYSVELLVPGYSKEDIKIEIENNRLVISAEAKIEELSENEKFTRKEFSLKSFSRTFTLPENKVNTDAIEAKYENGILKVILPKLAEELQKNNKKIAII